MKRLKHIINIALTAIILFSVSVGCDDIGALSIDPIVTESTFTFEPTEGFAGNSIKITGAGFDDVQKVAFGTTEAEVLQKSNEEITVIVPVGAKSGKIKLVRTNSIAESVENFVVDETPIPAITEFSPSIVGSGDVVTLTGDLFNQVDSVFVGELKVEIQPGTEAATMNIVIPAGFQTSRIRMFYNYMTDFGMVKVAESVSMTEISLELPSITAIDLDITALNIGDELIINGTMFDEVTMVQFAGVDAVYTVVSETEISVTVPVGVISGTISLTVLDGVIESDTFTVLLPSISSFTPEKGAELPGSTRFFALQGSMLDLVTSVTVGSVEANITNQDSELILFTTDGVTGGTINLHTANGIVSSEAPFFFLGDFWLTDWDTDFEVVRYDNIANRNLGSLSESVISEGGNNYSEVTMGGAIHNNGFYLWGPDIGNDRFSLYTSNPEGVYLEFDMRVTSIADSLKQADGTFQFKIFAMDSRGWGASGESSYGSNSPTSYVQTNGEWQHFRMHLDDFVASDNNGLYTADQITSSGNLKPDAWCHPNSLRILAFVFATTNTTGTGDVVMGMDNIKFVIE